MAVSSLQLPVQSLVPLGIATEKSIHFQLSPEELVREAVRRREGVLSSTAALVIRTGNFTGRSPRDRFIVREPGSPLEIDWNEYNQPMEPEQFDRMLGAVVAHLNGLPEIWVRDGQAGADERYRLRLRVVNEFASGNLFAYNMFLRPEADAPAGRPDWHILVAPSLAIDPAVCGTPRSNAVAIHFGKRLILVAGTGYTGEVKKAVFTILNGLLPYQGVLPMHCAANVGAGVDTALFFGLSGTGKTTLSADAGRHLVGDDEHGWSEQGVFNFEGGCYAKTINLHPEREPQIYAAIREGALLENIVFYPGTDIVDYSNSRLTENTRVSYPLPSIPGSVIPSLAGHPKHLFFLTCDAYGVLPPLSRLSPEQAMYQFLSGYTAKIAGTEAGITEPKSTFSTCFGAPFMPLHPGRYAAMLGEKLRQHQTNVWLVNTGWTGGAYGTGSRMRLDHTRSLVRAALSGALDDLPLTDFPVFRFRIPAACPGVPSEILRPQDTWSDPQAYADAATALARRFQENFARFGDQVSPEVRAAGPIC